MKKVSKLESELFLIDWNSPKIFSALEQFKDLRDSDIAFALILFNFIEQDRKTFPDVTERFELAIDIAISQIDYAKELLIVDPTIH